MGYLNKNTSSLLDIKLTDAARKKMSEGNFNISYFQVGDSEVDYNHNDYTKLNIIQSSYNQQNNSPIPERNKASVKYPLFLNSTSSNNFGIPINLPQIDEVYNTASPRGFFTGTTGPFKSVIGDGDHCINNSYTTTVNLFLGGDSITLSLTTPVDNNGDISIGDYVVFYTSSNLDPIQSNIVTLTFKITGIILASQTITLFLDRNLPNYGVLGLQGIVRAFVYPPTLAPFYDYETPDGYYANDGFNFENNCDSNGKDVKIWNLNNPWRESLAGTFTSTNKGFTDYGSYNYLSTMEYLGYLSNDGQVENTSTYFINSLGEKINVLPDHQKCISIIHYSNNTIDNFYGEKFALKPMINNEISTGVARNFSIDIPTLMWHKNKNGLMGETFYVDPPGFEDENLFQVEYMNSSKNPFMNTPGLRFYHLWDTNKNEDGMPNRIGKVWPDLKMITIDDEEISASLNYKSNRNWTLPAPQISLVAPNTFNGNADTTNGLLVGTGETLWVTYRFTNEYFGNSLHCNYYQYITGNNPDCPPESSNVIVKFGKEFKFLINETNGQNINGFAANRIELIVQKTNTGDKPESNKWKILDVTEQINNPTGQSFLTEDLISSATFQVSKIAYDSAGFYNLNSFINLPTLGSEEEELNFGDEFFFYGTLKTDIQATIYVMNYACNLGGSQFTRSSNPTSSTGTTPYISEVGLFDDKKDLMVIAKLQSPELRQGVQQFSIKLDF